MILNTMNGFNDDRHRWKTVKVYTARGVAAHHDLRNPPIGREMTYEGLPLVKCRTETPVSLSKGLSLAKEYEDKGYVVELRRTS